LLMRWLFRRLVPCLIARRLIVRKLTVTSPEQLPARWDAVALFAVPVLPRAAGVEMTAVDPAGWRGANRIPAATSDGLPLTGCY